MWETCTGSVWETCTSSVVGDTCTHSVVGDNLYLLFLLMEANNQYLDRAYKTVLFAQNLLVKFSSLNCEIKELIVLFGWCEYAKTPVDLFCRNRTTVMMKVS